MFPQNVWDPSSMNRLILNEQAMTKLTLNQTAKIKIYKVKINEIIIPVKIYWTPSKVFSVLNCNAIKFSCQKLLFMTPFLFTTKFADLLSVLMIKSSQLIYSTLA